MDITLTIPDIQIDYIAEQWWKDMEDETQTNSQFVTEYVNTMHTQELIDQWRQHLMNSLYDWTSVAGAGISSWTFDSLILSGQDSLAHTTLRNGVRAYLDALDADPDAH